MRFTVEYALSYKTRNIQRMLIVEADTAEQAGEIALDELEPGCVIVNIRPD